MKTFYSTFEKKSINTKTYTAFAFTIQWDLCRLNETLLFTKSFLQSLDVWCPEPVKILSYSTITIHWYGHNFIYNMMSDYLGLNTTIEHNSHTVYHALQPATQAWTQIRHCAQIRSPFTDHGSIMFIGIYNIKKIT